MTTAQRVSVTAYRFSISTDSFRFPSTRWAGVGAPYWPNNITSRSNGLKQEMLVVFNKRFRTAANQTFDVLEWYGGAGPFVKTPDIVGTYYEDAWTIVLKAQFTLQPWSGTVAQSTDIAGRTIKTVQSSDEEHFVTIRASAGGQVYQLGRPVITTNVDAFGFTYYTYVNDHATLRASQTKLNKIPRTIAAEDAVGLADPQTTAQREASIKTFPRIDGDRSPDSEVVSTNQYGVLIGFVPEATWAYQIVGANNDFSNSNLRGFLNAIPPANWNNDGQLRGTPQQVEWAWYRSAAIGDPTPICNTTGSDPLYDDGTPCSSPVYSGVGTQTTTVHTWAGETPETYGAATGKWFFLPSTTPPTDHKFRTCADPRVTCLANDGTTVLTAGRTFGMGATPDRAITRVQNCP